MAKSKIGVIGSGPVGQRLAAGFAKLGHPVTMGTREPAREDVKAWLASAPAGARVGTNDEAAQFGDVIVLATGWEGTQNALKLAKPENLRGKVLLDVTNPLAHPDDEGMPALAVGHKDSGGEQVQRWAPGARVVKSLNIVNNAQMVAPGDYGHPTMFLCGDDEAAKDDVRALLGELGWKDIIDLGGIDGARLMEPLAMVWIVQGFRSGKWTHALKMLPAQ